jgi:hypothetical protein
MMADLPAWIGPSAAGLCLVLVLALAAALLRMRQLGREIRQWRLFSSRTKEQNDHLHRELGSLIDWSGSEPLPEDLADRVRARLTSAAEQGGETFGADTGDLALARHALMQAKLPLAPLYRRACGAEAGQGHHALVALLAHLVEHPEALLDVTMRSEFRHLVCLAVRMEAHDADPVPRTAYLLALAVLEHRMARAGLRLALVRPFLAVPRDQVRHEVTDYDLLLDEPSVLERAERAYRALLASDRADSHVIVLDCLEAGINGQLPKAFVFDRSRV